MKRVREWLRERNTYLIISIILFVFLLLSEADHYARFFGHIQPVFVFTFAFLMGLFFVPLIQNELRGQKARFNKTGICLAFVLAACFMIPALLLDIFGRFSDSQIFFLQSLLFYPVIGFIVEIFFHIVPLTILTLAGYWLNFRMSEYYYWLILPVAMIEVAFQVILGIEERSLLFSLLIGLHVFLINIAGLLLLQRYSFMAMYSLRLFYYFFWHILWGVLRLKVLS